MKSGEDIKYQQVLELRYEPMPYFLDVKGTLAEQIKQQTEFKFWSISSNRIDLRVTEDSDRERAFISFRNCGYVAVFPSTKNYFSDKSQKLFKSLFAIENFNPSNFIRLGMKTTIAIPTKKTFDELVQLLEKNYIKDTGLLEKAYGGKVIDVGFPLNFQEGDNFFNTHIGAMRKSQLVGFFTEARKVEDDLPETCLFFEIDIFTNKIDKKDSVINSIRQFSDKTWNVFNSVTSPIVG